MVNVVDLMTLQPREEHSHGLPDRHFDAIRASMSDGSATRRGIGTAPPRRALRTPTRYAANSVSRCALR
ncbi:hypothetical protein JCM17961_31560 [Endothiovibrio diazotrophicus]